MSVLAIDPGLQGTGVAYWAQEDRARPDLVTILKAKRAEENWVVRAEQITKQLLRIDQRIGGADRFVCELMEMHGGSRSMMMWHGDLQRTLVLIGMMASNWDAAAITLVPPSEWKGQLPKAVVERRLKQILGHATYDKLGITSHAADAVGIGLWAMGKF